MLAYLVHFLGRERGRLVQDCHRNERLADIVQQRSAGKPALIVLAHAEVLGERHRKAGDEQAVAIAVGVMTADRRQPFPQRGMLDGLEDLVFGLHDIAEFQRLAGRKLLENLDHDAVRRLDAAVQGLAAIGLVVGIVVRKCRPDALQDALRVEWPGNGVGGAERPGLHRAVMQRVRQHEQARHLAIGLGLQLAAHQLHAFGRTKIDIDHDAGEIARRCGGNLRRRDGVDLADGLQDVGQFAALIASIRRQQQPALGRGLIG